MENYICRSDQRDSPPSTLLPCCHHVEANQYHEDIGEGMQKVGANRQVLSNERCF